MVKNLPAMQETQLSSLDQKDPLEKGMATHSSIPAWRIPWTENTNHGVVKIQTRLSDSTFTSLTPPNTHISIHPFSHYLSLMAVSTFLKNSYNGSR